MNELIIMITGYYFPTIGGISTYIRNLEDKFKEHDIDTVVIAYPPSFRFIEKRVKNKPINIIFQSVGVSCFIVYSLIYIISKRCTHSKLIVHSHSENYCLLISVLSKLFGCRSIHTYHSPLEQNSNILRYFSPISDGIVFVSDFTKKQYQRCTGAENTNTRIIPGGVDKSKYNLQMQNKSNTMSECIKKFKISSKDVKILLFVGRITEDKGIIPLISSLNETRKQIPSVKLIIVGPFNKTIDQKKCYQEALNLIKEHDLDKNIIFAGSISDSELMDLYAICDVFLCPSIWDEPAPMVTVEAMAMEKPIIVSRVGGLQNKVIHGKTGYLTEPNNSKEISEYCVSLLSNENLRSVLGQNSRKLFESKFTLDSMAHSYLDIYGLL